jgi:hypothetical protein
MKKKLLPYILGCSMMAAMPLMASAETTHHSGTDIIGGTSTAAGDLTDAAHTALTGDGHNEFTEYNDPSTTNTRAKTFGTPGISGGNVDWSTNPSSLGNTRSTTDTIQDEYEVGLNNEQKDYRTNNPLTTLAQDLTNGTTSFTEANTNDTAGTTDLETAIPEYDMTIPAKTVLPIGATHWRLGNVKIAGKYFVRPDKVDVIVTHDDFKHSTYDEGGSAVDKAARTIEFTVSDKALTDAALDNTKHRYFFQDGKHTGANHDTDTMQSAFPYAYTGYSSDRYKDGYVSEINETHQVWLNAAASEWLGKIKGTYTGSITFTANVETTDTDTVPTMYDAANLYPGEGSET